MVVEFLCAALCAAIAGEPDIADDLRKLIGRVVRYRKQVSA